MERSAGAIIFYQNKKRDTIKYLLLHYPKIVHNEKTRIPSHWDFPKGHIEKGEREHETAKREIREETGISQLTFIPNFRETMRYFFVRDGKRIFKEVVLYLAQSDKKNIQLSFEHLDYIWLLYEQALQKTTYKNAKTILQKANQFLTNNKSADNPCF